MDFESQCPASNQSSWKAFARAAARATQHVDTILLQAGKLEALNTEHAGGCST